MPRDRRLPSTLLLLTLLLPAAAPAEPGDAWPSFRGPRGDGRAAGTLPDGPLRLEKRWLRTLGSGYSGIAIGGGLLVTAAQAGERDVVVALDPATGDERWRYDLAPAYAGHDGSHDGPIATPAIGGGRVFALSPSGHLAALDLQSGEAVWTRNLVDDLGSEAPFYGFGSSPVVAGDTVVLQVGGEDGSVAGFAAASGELRWRSVEDGIDAQSPVAAEIAGRTQVLVIGAERVAGLDPADGAVLWQHEHGGGQGAMGAPTSSPLPLDGDRIFLKHDNDATRVLAVAAGESGLEPAVLTESRGLSKSYSPPAAWGEAIYGYTGRFLSAVDPATGELLWKSRDPGDGFLVAVDGALAVLTKKGTLHLGAASPEGWAEADRLELFSDLAWTPPSVSGSSLYLRSLGEIARVDLVPGAADAPAMLVNLETPLPAALEGLATELAAADDPDAVLGGFLAAGEVPRPDGDRALFLWRGDADDVAVAGDMIGMRREEPMRRLAGTDLWWWETELDQRARVSYLFFVDDRPTLDPAHARTVWSTVLGPDMNWQRGERLEMSWFAMPEWPGLSGAPNPARGRLETISVEVAKPAAEEAETVETVPVTLHVWLPPGYEAGDQGPAAGRYPVTYVHHPGAREAGRWVETLDRVVGRTVAPLITVFVERPRMRGFAEAFVDTVVPAVDERYRTRAERDGRANVGMGFSSVAATTLTFNHGDTFGRLGIQSFYAIDVHMGRVEEALGDTTADERPLRIYFEWGKWDLISPHEAMDMRRSSRWFDALLRHRGFQPVGGEVADSTDFASWRNRTDLLLEALFPIAGETPPAGLARWLTAP